MAEPLAHQIAGKNTSFTLTASLSLNLILGVTAALAGGAVYQQRRNVDILAEAQTEELSYSGLQPTERRIMHELEERLLQAWVSYVNLSTPLGWAHTVASRIGRRLRPGKPNRRAQADSLPTLAAKDVCRLPARRSPITGRRLGVRVGR